MKKTLLAAAALAVVAVPAVLAAAFVFGCCALPFHHVLHKMMPLCSIAVAAFMPEAPDTTPAKEEQPRTKIATDLPRVFRAPVLTAALFTAPPILAARSSLSPGAARCDHDVGLHLLLLVTFRI